MSIITAELVKELREKSGAGMMDCKKALSETNGNVEEAIDWLRTKGLATAAKKSGRVAAEGLVAVACSGTKCAVVEINAETDFVGRNDKFQAFVAESAKIALEKDGNFDAMTTASYPGTGRTVSDELTHLIATVGENMNLRRSTALEVKQGLVTSYIHNAVVPGMGRIGVLVALESSADKGVLEGLAKQIAMHVAAASPTALTISEVNAEDLERERNVLKEQALASGKPAEFLDKMVEGRIRKYYEEVVLEEQIFVMDGKTKIKDVVAEAGKAAGADIKLTGYVLYVLGEGIEKEEKDFAAEVAATLGK